jgi:hypothetical protein
MWSLQIDCPVNWDRAESGLEDTDILASGEGGFEGGLGLEVRVGVCH